MKTIAVLNQKVELAKQRSPLTWPPRCSTQATASCLSILTRKAARGTGPLCGKNTPSPL